MQTIQDRLSSSHKGLRGRSFSLRQDRKNAKERRFSYLPHGHYFLFYWFLRAPYTSHQSPAQRLWYIYIYIYYRYNPHNIVHTLNLRVATRAQA